MFENVIYPVIVGFATTLVALEAAWHFTVCKISDKTLKPCLFRQVKTIVVPSNIRE